MGSYMNLTESQRWAAACFGTLPGLRTECDSGGPFADPADEWMLTIKPELVEGAPTRDAWESLSWLVWFFTDVQRGYGEQTVGMYPFSAGDGASDLSTSLVICTRASETAVPLGGLAQFLIRLWRESSQQERHPRLEFPAGPPGR